MYYASIYLVIVPEIVSAMTKQLLINMYIVNSPSERNIMIFGPAHSMGPCAATRFYCGDCFDVIFVICCTEKRYARIGLNRSSLGGFVVVLFYFFIRVCRTAEYYKLGYSLIR